eukprot:8018348-Pyramimonas_sp.AAC.1
MGSSRGRRHSLGATGHESFRGFEQHGPRGYSRSMASLVRAMRPRCGQGSRSGPGCSRRAYSSCP